MRRGGNIRAVERLGVDWMGFIFYPKSQRFVEKMPSYLPKNAKRVGVFVNETIEKILQYVKNYDLDIVQLHGDELPVMCRDLKEKGVRVIKAFGVAVKEDLEAVKPYIGVCDFFLFDTKSPDKGGSGNVFPWNILKTYRGNTPFLLSGGIGMGSVEDLCRFKHPQWVGVDLNSCFEVSAGEKDALLLERFIEKIKQI